MKIVKGTILNHNVDTEKKYQKRLLNLVDKMIEETTKEIERLFKTETAKKHFGMDASISSQSRILMNALRKKFELLFTDFDYWIKAMVNQTDRNSKLNIKQATQAMAYGVNADFTNSRLKDIFKAVIEENVSLITSIQEEYLNDITGYVMRSITTGQGIKELIPNIHKISGQTRRRAKNIALDQTRKAYNSINKERMQSVGIEEYEWIHSHGGLNPRLLHLRHSGKIFRFDDPPVIDERTGEKGIPGQAINCKCSMRPIIRIENA